MVRTRELQPAEWRTWKDLRLEALEEAPDAFGDTILRARARSDEEWEEYFVAAARDGRFFIAEDSGESVGMARVERSGDGSSVAGLYSMWVAPSLRGKGIGRALVEAALEWADRAGAEAAVLWVTQGNQPAEGLYRAMGFVATGKLEPLRPGSRIQMEAMARPMPQGVPRDKLRP